MMWAILIPLTTVMAWARAAPSDPRIELPSTRCSAEGSTSPIAGSTGRPTLSLFFLRSKLATCSQRFTPRQRVTHRFEQSAGSDGYLKSSGCQQATSCTGFGHWASLGFDVWQRTHKSKNSNEPSRHSSTKVRRCALVSVADLTVRPRPRSKQPIRGLH